MSGDGKTIVFVQAGDHPNHVFVINADGSGQREIDSYDSRVGKPAGTEYTLLASSPFTDDQTGNRFTHNSSIYKSTAGNYVWATGSMDWAWTLAPGGSSDGTKNNVRPQLQTMTKNILNKMIATAPTPPTP